MYFSIINHVKYNYISCIKEHSHDTEWDTHVTYSNTFELSRINSLLNIYTCKHFVYGHQSERFVIYYHNVPKLFVLPQHNPQHNPQPNPQPHIV